MKALNIYFEDDDFEELLRFKGKKLSWRDFILLLKKHCIEAEKKGEFEIIR